ncbi:MAG: hypothetical protein Q4C41_06600 [Eggerthellaceae bacterium]|nr:hypothetical protein [Eggerthellaceae bacterium]
MGDARTYQLKIYDTPLAQFRFERTIAGFRARGLEVDDAHAHLLPLNIMQAQNDVELDRFLSSRRIPKGRMYLENLLRPYGLNASDTKGIIDLSRGVSVNDAYSVVPAVDDIPYADYNLFENDFDEVLQIIAYTGVVPDGVVGNGRPSDLTLSGTFPKTWRKVDGKLVLYKAGSTVAAPNYGKEPFAEALAWQVARAGGFDAVEYGLTVWNGKVCSTCELFNTPEVSFVPFDLCLPAELSQLCDFELALAYFADISPSAAEKFKSMAVFDSIVANTDRHVGNFGVLRDNRSGRILDAAPIFDNNVSLFTRDFDGALVLERLLDRTEQSPGILEATLAWQGRAMLGESQRAQVERLRAFEFDGDVIAESCGEHDGRAQRRAMSAARLEALEHFVRARAGALLN